MARMPRKTSNSRGYDKNNDRKSPTKHVDYIVKSMDIIPPAQPENSMVHSEPALGARVGPDRTPRMSLAGLLPPAPRGDGGVVGTNGERLGVFAARSMEDMVRG